MNDVADGMWHDSDGRDQERVEVGPAIFCKGREDKDEYFERIVDGEAVEKGGSGLLTETVNAVRGWQSRKVGIRHLTAQWSR